MHSYFKDGIADCTPCKKISIETLVKEIKANNTPTIQKIRALDFKDINYDADKRKLKQHLPNITPNCTVSYRDQHHIIEFSGYIYFEVDDLDCAAEYKTQLINKYKDHISLLSLSASGRGVSMLIKFENEITDLNFNSIHEYITKNLFKGIVFDLKTKIKTAAWYIPYDPDCYFNPSAVVLVPNEFIKTNLQLAEKSAKRKQYNTSTDCVHSALFSYKLIPISEVLDKLVFKTKVEVENRVFDLKPVEYCEVFIGNQYRIPKGEKQKIFSQVIHNLYYLNPGIDPEYIFSYINWLNFNKTVPGTEATSRDLKSFFDMVYSGIKENGILKPAIRIKNFHCRPNTISPFEQNKLSRKMTNMFRTYQSIEKISIAKQILELVNENSAKRKQYNTSHDCLRFAPENKITQQAVYELIKATAEKNGGKGLGIRSIKTYWNVDLFDLDEYVRTKNENIKITYIVKEESQSQPVAAPDDHTSILDTQIQPETEIVIEHKPDAGMSPKKKNKIEPMEKKKVFTVDGLLNKQKEAQPDCLEEKQDTSIEISVTAQPIEPVAKIEDKTVKDSKMEMITQHWKNNQDDDEEEYVQNSNGLRYTDIQIHNFVLSELKESGMSRSKENIDFHIRAFKMALRDDIPVYVVKLKWTYC